MRSSAPESNAARTFARNSFVWLHDLAADPSVSANAVRLGVVLHKFVNHKTLTAWPAISTLAAKIGASRRTTQRLCGELMAAGYLVAVGKNRGGRAKTNTLRIVFKNRKASAEKGVMDDTLFGR